MTNIIETVDQLGKINAEIASLEASARKLKEELKALGKGVYEGNLYFADVQFNERADIKPELVRKLVDADTLAQVTVTSIRPAIVVKQLQAQA